MYQHPAKTRAGFWQNPVCVTRHAARASTRVFSSRSLNSVGVYAAGRLTGESRAKQRPDTRRPARRSTAAPAPGTRPDSRHRLVCVRRHRRRSPRRDSRHRRFCDRGHRRQSELSQTVIPATGAGETADRASDRASDMPCLPCLPCLETTPCERRAIPVEHRRNTPAAGRDSNHRRLSLLLSPPVCAAVCRRRCLCYRAHVAANDESITTHPQKPCSRQGRQGNDRAAAECPVREIRRTAPVLDRADRADTGFSERCVVYGTPFQRARGRALYGVSGGFAGAATRSETCNDSDTPRPPRRSRRARAPPRRGPGRASRHGPAQLCVLCRRAPAAPTAAHGGKE